MKMTLVCLFPALPLWPITGFGGETAEELVSLLRTLRVERRSKNVTQRQFTRRRRPFSITERQRVHAKTAGRCHICGGMVEEGWQAESRART